MISDLCETHRIGDTAEQIAAVETCPPLATVGIRWTGLSDAGHGYAMIRRRPAFEHLLVGLGGEGLVLVGGAWHRCRSGQAYLCPPQTTHAFETVSNRSWSFCWIIFAAPGH